MVHSKIQNKISQRKQNAGFFFKSIYSESITEKI